MNDFDFDHARRVAARVNTSDLRLVALLHDAVEDGNLRPDQARETVGDGAVLEAIRLVTRPKTMDYGDYIRRLFDADGYAGYLARSVKIADLTENLSRMDAEHESLRPRYEQALDLLKRRPAVVLPSEWDNHDGLVWDEPSDDPQEQRFRDAVNQADREARGGCAVQHDPWCAIHGFFTGQCSCGAAPGSFFASDE
jgi:hypothetical protein